MRIHDLLEIDAERFLQANAAVPPWVGASARKTPYVVVRRGPVCEQSIPVGVRGSQRSERWAGFCRADGVKRVLTPNGLLRQPISLSRSLDIPALRSVPMLAERWQDVGIPWGPGGSVGFELATGREVVRPQSDLDIVMYAERPITPGEAKDLLDSAQGLPAAVDIRMETPVCGFSLVEYADRAAQSILLRSATGAVLGQDPWDDAGGPRGWALDVAAQR
jgi:phosphoribosyl-dephospho-CoA transferase